MRHHPMLEEAPDRAFPQLSDLKPSDSRTCTLASPESEEAEGDLEHAKKSQYGLFAGGAAASVLCRARSGFSGRRSPSLHVEESPVSAAGTSSVVVGSCATIRLASQLAS